MERNRKQDVPNLFRKPVWCACIKVTSPTRNDTQRH